MSREGRAGGAGRGKRRRRRRVGSRLEGIPPGPSVVPSRGPRLGLLRLRLPPAQLAGAHLSVAAQPVTLWLARRIWRWLALSAPSAPPTDRPYLPPLPHPHHVQPALCRPGHARTPQRDPPPGLLPRPSPPSPLLPGQQPPPGPFFAATGSSAAPPSFACPFCLSFPPSSDPGPNHRLTPALSLRPGPLRQQLLLFSLCNHHPIITLRLAAPSSLPLPPRPFPPSLLQSNTHETPLPHLDQTKMDAALAKVRLAPPPPFRPFSSLPLLLEGLAARGRSPRSGSSCERGARAGQATRDLLCRLCRQPSGRDLSTGPIADYPPCGCFLSSCSLLAVHRALHRSVLPSLLPQPLHRRPLAQLGC